jgi:A/G-specific adenine glycosylase
MGPVPVIDGNVFGFCLLILMLRLIFGFRQKEFAALAFELMPKDNPAIFNQAIMGLVLCNVFLKSRLQYLYFNESCAAAKKNKVDQLPVKSKN